MKMIKDKDKQKKSHHVLDQWPPPRENNQAADETKRDLSKPRNPSYRSPDEYLDSGVEPVYEGETEAERMEREEEERKDEEKEEKQNTHDR